MVDIQNLILLHEELDDFARHHQRIGGEIAQKVIMQIRDKNLYGYSARDSSPEGMKYDEGFESAIKIILEHLEKEFSI